jgi:hypothetical protein
MPSKRWFVQIYPVGDTPKTPMVFSDPEKVCAFIEEFRKAGSSGAVLVYSTGSATNKEEKQTSRSGISKKQE